MIQIVSATFEDGVLRPAEEVHLAAGTKVRLTIEPCEDAKNVRQHACEELDDLCDEFPIDSGGQRLTRDQLHERG